MIHPLPVSDEAARLVALAEYDIFDTPKDRAFDDLVELAARICEAPISLISLIDRDRQWFKAKVGIDANETSRTISFCAHAIHFDDLLIVPDALQDPRFFDNPLVAGEPQIRFYAGAPLRSPEGHALGTLCVIDRVPRELRPDHAHALSILSRHVMTQLELRRKSLEVLRLEHERESERRIALSTAENEKRYRLLFDKNPHSMWVFDVDTLRFLDVNVTTCERYGFTKEEFLQLSVRDIVLPEDRGVPPRGTVERHVTKQGEVLFVEVTSHPIEFNGRKARLVLATDVTVRERSEQVRVRLDIAVEQAAESIIISNSDGTIVYVNPAFERISGYRRQEVLGQNPRILQSGIQSAEFYEKMWVTVVSGQVWNGRLTNKRKDGTFYEVEMSVSPVRSHDGTIVNFVAVQRDVTREQLLEAQLRQSQKMEAIGQLAGGIAHDFNNILTVIQGTLALLLESTEAADSNQVLLKEAAQATERAATLTRQLLVFSRKEALRPKLVSVSDVVVQLSRMLDRLLGESIVFRCIPDPNLPPILADRGMIEQVVLNLVLNARDAMPKGGTIEVEIKMVARLPENLYETPGDLPQGAYVCLRVSDTGTGIEPRHVPRIFEPFFTTKTQSKGTGLGLATVYGIIKQHRGFVSVDSTLGQGTTFRVYFPGSAHAETETVGQLPSSRLPKGNETILVVEDDDAVRGLVTRVLGRCGYDVLSAVDGHVALDVLREHIDDVSLLYTDLGLPGGLSGLALADQARMMKPSLKVVYTTGYGPNQSEKHPVVPSGSDLVRKPWTPSELTETIRTCLNR